MSMQPAILQPTVALEQQVSWDDLRLFLAIFQEDSVRGAASRLNIHASTVSRRLAQLEQQLGASLFERHPTGLRLTPVGEETARLGQRLHGQVEYWQQLVRAQSEEIVGTVRITSAEVMGAVASRCVAELCQRYPTLSVELSISDAMMHVQRHEVDVALRVADAPGDELVGRKVGKSGVGVYASRGYLQRQEQLDQAEDAFVEWPDALRHKPAFAWLDKHYPARQKKARASSATGVLSLVRAGLGMAVLGVAQASEFEDLICVRRLPARCSTSVWLLSQACAQRPAKIRATLDCLAHALVQRSAEWE